MTSLRALRQTLRRHGWPDWGPCRSALPLVSLRAPLARCAATREDGCATRARVRRRSEVGQLSRCLSLHVSVDAASGPRSTGDPRREAHHRQPHQSTPHARTLLSAVRRQDRLTRNPPRSPPRQGESTFVGNGAERVSPPNGTRSNLQVGVANTSSSETGTRSSRPRTYVETDGRVFGTVKKGRFRRHATGCPWLSARTTCGRRSRGRVKEAPYGRSRRRGAPTDP